MAQSNTLPPGTGSQMIGFDTYSWTNPGNITTANITYASFTVVGDATITDYNIQLVDDSGSLVGDNKASATAWTSTLSYFTYGSSTDMWGTTLTVAQVNDTDFGLALQVIDSIFSLTSFPLLASNYGYAIPTKAKITGFAPQIRRFRLFNSRTGLTTVNVDYVPMTIHYSIFMPKVNIQFFGLIGLVSNLASMGWLRMFNIHKIERSMGGVIIHKSQARRAKSLSFI